MKTLIAAVALATLIASPVLARVPVDQISPNAAYCFGKVTGQDPDAAIRSELARDCGWQKGGAYK
jgi:hypothetical protein